MKRICVVVTVFAAFALLTISCKKDKTEPAAIQPVMYIPTTDAPYAASIMTPNNSGIIAGSSLTNIWGIFMETALESRLNDSSGTQVDHNDYWQEAFFCGADGTGFTSAKAVYINNVPATQRGNFYSTNSDWHGNSLNLWGVSGDANVPEISANMMDEYPTFTGTIPTNVSLTNGLAYTFITSKITKADSAYILIHSNGLVAKSNTVSVKTGSGPVATISKAQLANMHNEYFTLNDKTFHGAILEVVLYKDTLETFSNKQFAFVNQRQIVRKIVFN